MADKLSHLAEECLLKMRRAEYPTHADGDFSMKTFNALEKRGFVKCVGFRQFKITSAGADYIDHNSPASP